MEHLSFDDFLHALQSSLVDAHNAVTARFEESGTAEGAGSRHKAAMGTVQPVLSPDDGEGDGVGAFPLANTLFHGRRRHRISMLSLEFDCFLETKDRSENPGRYILTIKNKNAPSKTAAHRMIVAFGGVSGFAGVVGLDGHVLMEVPAYRARKTANATHEKKEPFFLRIFSGLRAGGKEEGFMMTEEQTEMARKIAERLGETSGKTE